MGIFTKKENQLKITNLNDEQIKNQALYAGLFDKSESKRLSKLTFKSSKRTFLLDFKGDVYASSVKKLAKEISFILTNAKKDDEVIIMIESPGGTVTGYGLVAEQLDRLRNANIKITAVVDQVAASGGYLVAAVADKIIAAKRAVIGSIGVVVGMPNYSEVLNKIGVNYSFYTAGEKKRGVTPFKVPTEAQVKDLEEELKDIHDQFKNHILNYRPDIDMSIVATGETWTGLKALELGLIDELGISDDLIMSHIKLNRLVLKIEYNEIKRKKGFLSLSVSSITEDLIETISNKLVNHIQNITIKKY